MNLLRRLFKSNHSANPSALPDIPFGRYTDAYKSAEQQALWDKSLQLFDQNRHLDAYRIFLQYLRNEDDHNIRWEDTGGALHFEFWQGSQRITGVATALQVKAESRVARAGDLNVSFLRRLMEYNFTLRYCRFALTPDDCLCIVFDTSSLDGSPFKLLHALRELALHADKQDDLLLDEFRSLSPVEERTYGEIPEAEKEAKYQFIRREIQATLREIDASPLDPGRFPGSFCYLLLGLAFKLDYLVKPEGFMMDVLERIYGIYFAKSGRSTQEKMQAIRAELEKLLERPREKFFAEMYRTRNTFGLNPAINHGTVAGMIEGELPHMEWALQNNYLALALAVPQYIVGLTLFQGAPPRPDRDLFHLFYRVTEAAYFQELGYPNLVTDVEGRLMRKPVLQEINGIVDRYRAEYPALRPDTSRLDFGSRVLFARTFLQMIVDLNLTRAE